MGAYERSQYGRGIGIAMPYPAIVAGVAPEVFSRSKQDLMIFPYLA